MGVLERIGLRKAEETGGKSLGGKIVKVAPGDTLAKIAMREYGDENKWEVIFQANRRIVTDPDSLYPGMDLKLP
jgi:nucleoid-associated protein YgaU